jgi:hypothetical protein
MSKYTPEPWNIEENLDYGDELWYGGPKGFTITVGPAVLGDTNKSTIPEHQANARLIAAAPEMLACLKALQHFTEQLVFNRDLAERVNAAIDKAEGRE